MNAGTGRGWKTSKVNDKISHLTEKIVLVGVPVCCGITLVRPWHTENDDRPPPSVYGSESMTAMPAKFEAAFNVGRVIASPTNWV